jgi:hypothetical protein
MKYPMRKRNQTKKRGGNQNLKTSRKGKINDTWTGTTGKTEKAEKTEKTDKTEKENRTMKRIVNA